MNLKLYKTVLVFLCLIIVSQEQFAQVDTQLQDSILSDTLNIPQVSPDSILIDTTDNSLQNDLTEQTDSINSDSNSKKSNSDNLIDFPIDYNADDSIRFSLKKQKVYLYGNAKINYQEIELTAAYIEIDLQTRELLANGVLDSVGKLSGKPKYTEGEESFDATTMKYNFKSKKAYIIDVVTPQAEGFLHSHITKMHANKQIHLKNGKYTTCDREHPHFYIGLTKAIMIPDDKIVSGPAYLVLADVPLPLVIPFGFFPNHKKHASGVLIPEYGEEQNRGFFLRNGGYYFAINDYFDLGIRGDIYSKGTYGGSILSKYKKKYKYNGNINLKYYNNKTSEKDFPDYSSKKDFSIKWSHSQDAKANPLSSFSANVNISTSSFDQNQTYATNNHLTNTKSSSISYNRRFGKLFNMSSNLRHSQNSLNKSVNLTLPSVNFSMNRQYPFRRKNANSDMRWYEKIDVSYSSKLENRINTVDSLLFTKNSLKNFQNGFQHSIPISANFKALKMINITPRLDYTGRLYTNTIEKHWDAEYYDTETGTTYGKMIKDTINGLKYGHDYSAQISVSVNPTVYGMFQPNPKIFGDKIKAVRHVLTPSASFSYKPDLSDYKPDYYRSVSHLLTDEKDSIGITETYSIFEEGIYGTPSNSGKSGNLNLSLGNNIEMKVKSKNDTIDEYEKIKILEKLSFSTSYNFFADSLRWSPIRFSGSTKLFNKQINLKFGGSIDPYMIDSSGARYNSYELMNSHKLGRLTSANFDIGFSLNPKKLSNDKEAEEELIGDLYEDYIDWNVPWNLRVNYGFKYSKQKFESDITQTLRFSGDLSFTPKWKIGFSSGYDLEKNEFTYTTFDLYRDLHCWEMRMNFIPFGTRKSYNFVISVKSSILKDLRKQKTRSWYDNF